MKILFLAPRLGGSVGPRQLASFHQADVALLRDLGHDVHVLPWQGNPYARLLRWVAWSDLVYIWTVGDHTALAIIASLFIARPTVVVIGGYEFANLPDIDYGNLARWRGRRWSSFTWKHADALLFVDPSLMGEGERAFGPRANPSHIVPTGYDPDYWIPDGEKEDLVLTVAHCPGLNTLSLKGIDRFLVLASRFPDLDFAIAGELPPVLWDQVPRNVALHGWLERDALRGLMQKARVVCQLSRHEGLPNSLCEAMLTGAIPLGTRVNGIPAVIGTEGVITAGPWDDAAALRTALTMSLSDYAQEKARERIRRRYPIARRRESLRKVLSEVE